MHGFSLSILGDCTHKSKAVCSRGLTISRAIPAVIERAAAQHVLSHAAFLIEAQKNLLDQTFYLFNLCVLFLCVFYFIFFLSTTHQ